MISYNSRIAISIACAALSLTAYVDYLSGLELGLFPFYLLPIAVMSWKERARVNIWIVVIASASIAAKATFETAYPSAQIRYLDATIKILMLGLTSYFIFAIKKLLVTKDRLNTELTTAIAELQRTRDELRQANDLLEQKVAERTRELVLSVEDLKTEVAERTRLGQVLLAETAERLRVQEELREKELLLLQQSRLAAMGEMIGNIAHQWRQPLNALGLLAQELRLLYRAGKVDAEYLERHVKKTMEMIRHMSQTVQDFRDFFNPDKEKVRFDVVEIIRRTLSIVEGSLKTQGIKVKLEILGDAVVEGFPNEYCQVLINLLMNARDAFLARETPDPVISIAVGPVEGRAVVAITDNAGGVPEEIIDRIFHPYFTTKEAQGGTGIGLHMSKSIVERHFNGTLTVRNVGPGAEFTITT